MSSDRTHILDTVVLLYFLLVGEHELLLNLLGSPLHVPLAVYDPSDRSISGHASHRTDLLSEMRQAVLHYETTVLSGAAHRILLDRVRRVDRLYDKTQLTTIAMTDTESGLAARLQSRSEALRYGLRVPLGAGEAACVAIAWERSWTIATDDSAALIALDRLHGERTYAYERIRKLLVRAADDAWISKARANDIHSEMRNVGFWDSGVPFP